MFARNFFLVLLLCLTACGRFQPAVQDGPNSTAQSEATGRVIDRELSPTLTSEAVNASKNSQSFDRSDEDRLVTVRYKFSSGANTALDVDETTANCAELKATRLIGPKHKPDDKIAFKQELEKNSDYTLEFDVRPSCQSASFTPIVWIGKLEVEPTRYYKCDGDVLLPLHQMNLSVSVSGRLLISENKRLMCGEDFSKATEWSGSSQTGLDLFIGSVRTLETKVDGHALLATTKVDPKANTLSVSCAKDNAVYSNQTFSNCVQTIDDESILPKN